MFSQEIEYDGKLLFGIARSNSMQPKWSSEKYHNDADSHYLVATCDLWSPDLADKSSGYGYQ